MAHAFEATASPHSEVYAETHEDEESKDLECEARDHDVIARVRTFALVGSGGGEAAASSLEEETKEVAGDKLCHVSHLNSR